MQQRDAWQKLVTAILLTGALVSLSYGDTIWRKNGSKVTGKIVAEEEDRIQIRMKKGSIEVSVWIPRREIALVEKGKTPAEEFEERRAALAPHDLDGHRRLIEWAKRKLLVSEAKVLEGQLPTVEIAHRKHAHPRRWCRTCVAVGEVICVDCQGKGKVLIACERCEGSGKIRCEVCGHREGDGTLRCRRCSGAGEYERFNPAKGRKEKTRCPDCRGKGTHKCPQCGGKQLQPCPACEGEEGVEEKCESCQEQPRHTCTSCRGTGLQPTAVSEEQLAKEAEEAAQRAAEKEASQKPTSDPKVKPTSRPAPAGGKKMPGRKPSGAGGDRKASAP